MNPTGFNAETVRRLTGISYRQLDYWDRTGLVRPSVRGARGKGSRRVYSFQDLVEVRVVARMLASGVSLPTVRKAVRYLTRHFKDVTRPLAQLTLATDGKRVLFSLNDGKSVLDASAAGQVVIAVPIAAIAEELKTTVTEFATPRELRFKVHGQTYKAVLTPDLESGGFIIEVPALPGVVTEAETVADARRMARDATSEWLAAVAHSKARVGAAR